MKPRNRAILILLVIIVVALAFAGRNTQKKELQISDLPMPLTPIFYYCNGGVNLSALYQQGASTTVSPDQPPVPGGSVALTLGDGRTLTLDQTISADGARYANKDESIIFWSKGNGAFVLENNKEKTYSNCVIIVPQPAGTDLRLGYRSSSGSFTIRLPSFATYGAGMNIDGYKVDEKYIYQALGPAKEIKGTKFTIPTGTATGTNLSADAYISIEQIPNSVECSAKLFLRNGVKENVVTDGGLTYSVASSSDAALGNRYDENVYALSGTNPCIGIRYFIHYGVFENYPEGTIRQFDRKTLVKEFDDIRRTLTINQ